MITNPHVILVQISAVMGIFNELPNEEKWRTTKYIFKTRRFEFWNIGAICFIAWYWKTHRVERFSTHLNRSALFGGRSKELEKPELLEWSEPQPVQFSKDLAKIIETGKEK